MVKTMPRARRRLRYASFLAPYGKTISASIFHYMYFNIARILYLQVDNVFGLVLAVSVNCCRYDYARPDDADY
ncbi:putative microcin B17 uptake protein [Escherichia coli]|uniref:Putative microcin B17 uptake protein n=1 Tax=Escherichia coli TaxID=562 RepID=A0A484VY89_ECOLX|nr:putative microcin B17 uptake protein [Escherichia coli]